MGEVALAAKSSSSGSEAVVTPSTSSVSQRSASSLDDSTRALCTVTGPFMSAASTLWPGARLSSMGGPSGGKVSGVVALAMARSRAGKRDWLADLGPSLNSTSDW